jgi:hypothetical protein
MQYPQFAGSINLGTSILATASTASDGSGPMAVFLTGGSKFTTATFSTTDIITVANWSQTSEASIAKVKNGDIFSIVSTGGIPTGMTLSTDYLISNLSVNTTTDVATFYALDTTTLAIINITTDGTPPHTLRFPCGTRIDTIDFINAQLSPLITSANLGKIFIKPRNSPTWFIIREISLPALLRTASVPGQRQTITFTNGLFVPEGAQLAAQLYVYAGVQDKFNVIATQGYNL